MHNGLMFSTSAVSFISHAYRTFLMAKARAKLCLHSVNTLKRSQLQVPLQNSSTKGNIYDGKTALPQVAVQKN